MGSTSAIDQANATLGIDTIDFNIAGANKTITIDANRGALTPIIEAVIIDGYSQGGGFPGVYIEINGANLMADGLTFNTGGSTVRGLAINRFGGNGIVLNNPLHSPGNTIFGNFIGTDLTGTAFGIGNGGNGIRIQGSDNTVGAPCPCLWNLISGNVGHGVFVTGVSALRNVIAGNVIGLDNTGMAELANIGSGIFLSSGAANNTVGGDNFALANIISGNAQHGVYVYGSNSNRILGNYIGLGTDGSKILGNARTGVILLNESSNNIIGAANAGNVISGNGESGVVLSGPNITGNKIIGNLIGTDVNGAAQKANQLDGIRIDSTSANTIGGVNSGEANVISGNLGNGIRIFGAGATNNLVAANYIGTNSAGTAALGNGNNGIYIASNNNTVGVEGATARNIISGNAIAGIEIGGGNLNTVVNSYIGTNREGNAAIPNVKYGVVLGSTTTSSNDNTIGGTAAEATRNVISGNGTSGEGQADMGVYIRTGSTRNILQGNYIGTKADGLSPLGNGGDGVYIRNTAEGNTVGGPQAGAGNVISANGVLPTTGQGYGVAIEANNTLLTNNIIGLDKNGADPNNNMKNRLGWLFLTGGLTGVVTTPNQHQ